MKFKELKGGDTFMSDKCLFVKYEEERGRPSVAAVAIQVDKTKKDEDGEYYLKGKIYEFKPNEKVTKVVLGMITEVGK